MTFAAWRPFDGVNSADCSHGLPLVSASDGFLPARASGLPPCNPWRNEPVAARRRAVVPQNVMNKEHRPVSEYPSACPAGNSSSARIPRRTACSASEIRGQIPVCGRHGACWGTLQQVIGAGMQCSGEGVQEGLHGPAPGSSAGPWAPIATRRARTSGHTVPRRLAHRQRRHHAHAERRGTGHTPWNRSSSRCADAG